MNMLAHSMVAIVGLGNPGAKFHKTRHNIGFRIVDAVAEKYQLPWKTKGEVAYAEGMIHDKKVILIKPQTFMNSSGKVIPFVLKQGLTHDNMLVVHDELEKKFGVIDLKFGGSARGHNGLKSMIAACGDQFARLRFGIGRPEHKEQVPDYVLQPFSENPADLEAKIQQAVNTVEQVVAKV